MKNTTPLHALIMFLIITVLILLWRITTLEGYLKLASKTIDECSAEADKYQQMYFKSESELWEFQKKYWTILNKQP